MSVLDVIHVLSRTIPNSFLQHVLQCAAVLMCCSFWLARCMHITHYIRPVPAPRVAACCSVLQCVEVYVCCTHTHTHSHTRQYIMKPALPVKHRVETLILCPHVRTRAHAHPRVYMYIYIYTYAGKTCATGEATSRNAELHIHTELLSRDSELDINTERASHIYRESFTYIQRGLHIYTERASHIYRALKQLWVVTQTLSLTHYQLHSHTDKPRHLHTQTLTQKQTQT